MIEVEENSGAYGTLVQLIAIVEPQRGVELARVRGRPLVVLRRGHELSAVPLVVWTHDCERSVVLAMVAQILCDRVEVVVACKREGRSFRSCGVVNPRKLHSNSRG